jgi:hypothetical protein
MTELMEKRGSGFHLVSEGNGNISREDITVKMGEVLAVGAVLGKITSSGKYVAVNLAASDGSQVAAGVLFGAVDATAADTAAAAHVRLAEVLGAELVYGTTDAGEIATLNGQLADLNIIVR